MTGTDWSLRFVELAEHVATYSKDPSTKVGAVLVRGDKTIASVGYNGFPRGSNDHPSLYSNREEKYARTIHAEVNALLNAKEDLRGCHAFVTHPPCSNCSAALINAGIVSVTYRRPSEDLLSRWQDSILSAKSLLNEVGVPFTELP